MTSQLCSCLSALGFGTCVLVNHLYSSSQGWNGHRKLNTAGLPQVRIGCNFSASLHHLKCTCLPTSWIRLHKDFSIQKHGKKKIPKRGESLKFYIVRDAYALESSPWLYANCSGVMPTHWKRPWCWQRLRAGAEGDDRGWDGWMASLTWWMSLSKLRELMIPSNHLILYRPLLLLPSIFASIRVFFSELALLLSN